MSASCPALLISAPASGQGKTTLVAALARFHQHQGRKVRVFKTGPDFIDPMIHERASGAPVYQLDLWMVGESHCKQILYQAAQEADLILIEGVMGQFDGNPSSADLAIRFGVPVAAVVDASAMAQTFGAVAYGLANYRSELNFAGVIANRVASEGHGQMLRESVAEQHWLGGMMRSEEVALPERHLGLYQAMDIDDLEQRLNAAADMIANTALAQLPAAVNFEAAVTASLPQTLAGQRIAVAHDQAFSFVYRANLDLLQEMGAELRFFSPLSDQQLPECDSLYLPGGYPELYLQQLADNLAMKVSITDHHRAGKPILAECGGMLYLLESLTDKQGCAANMVGLIPAAARMQERLGGLGLQSAELPEGELKGHTFHYSCLEGDIAFCQRARRQRFDSEGEGLIRDGRLLASYIHWYFPSNPMAAAALFLGGEN